MFTVHLIAPLYVLIQTHSTVIAAHPASVTLRLYALHCAVQLLNICAPIGAAVFYEQIGLLVL
jgi:hypothetical protein